MYMKLYLVPCTCIWACIVLQYSTISNHICSTIKILTKSNQSVCGLLDFIAIKTIKNYSWRDEAASLSSHFTAFSNIWHSKSQSCRNSALFAPFFTLFKLPFKWIWKAFSSQEEFLKEFNLKMGVRTMEDRNWEWEKYSNIYSSSFPSVQNT